MGIGYTIGCLLSILLWSLKRNVVFSKIELIGEKYKRGRLIVSFIYLLILIAGLWLFLSYKNEWISFIAAFLIIDVSGSEKDNLNAKEVKFHNTIGLNCKALVCGFTAPLFYILVLGNHGGFLYFLLYQIADQGRHKIISRVINILNIIPSLLAQGILVLIALLVGCRDIDFKGDYIENTISRPLLNLEIIAASMESISFYYYFQKGSDAYMKAYGNEKNRLSMNSAIHYTGILYIAVFVQFLMFLAIYLMV